MKISRLTLIFLDLLALYVSIVLAVLVRGTVHNREIQTIAEWLSAHLFIFLPSAAFAIIAMYIAGLYDARTLYDKSKIPPLIIYTQISTAIFSILFFYFARTELTPKLTLFIYVIFSVTLLTITRIIITNSLLKGKKRYAIYLKDKNTLANLSAYNHNFAPYIFSQMEMSQFISNYENYKDKVEAIVYDKSLLKDINNFLFVEKIKAEGVECTSSEVYYEDLHKKVDLQNLDIQNFTQKFANKKEHAGHFLFRRFLDMTAAISILPFFIITLPIVFILNLFWNRGKLFSIQNRVGVLGKQIWIYKLRTMTTTDTGGTMNANGEAQAHALSKNTYTKIGNIWRKTRIDEFPQWINLLRNDISIIGPRSDVLGVSRDMSDFSNIYKLRLIVPQGLTGWAQVHMSKPPRTKEEHLERLAYELYYIKHRSILLDISIILKTIKTMIAREGA